MCHSLWHGPQGGQTCMVKTLRRYSLSTRATLSGHLAVRVRLWLHFTFRADCSSRSWEEKWWESCRENADSQSAGRGSCRSCPSFYLLRREVDFLKRWEESACVSVVGVWERPFAFIMFLLALLFYFCILVFFLQAFFFTLSVVLKCCI